MSPESASQAAAPSVRAADLFSVNGLVAVITGGGSGKKLMFPWHCA